MVAQGSPNPYESERYLQEYLLLHYGRPRDCCPFDVVAPKVLRFHERLRQECLLPLSRRARSRPGPTRALDLGCGVGRFSFELGCVADEVLGIDSSEGFICAAQRLAAGEVVEVWFQESGRRVSRRRLVLPKVWRSRGVAFEVGNAMALERFSAEPFEIVAAIHLLCRLPQPRGFLRQLHEIVAPGGQLLLASPFSWLESYTAPGEWLEAEEVLEILRPHFRLARRRDLPFLIREHRRKYQLVVSDVMGLRRTGQEIPPEGGKGRQGRS